MISVREYLLKKGFQYKETTRSGREEAIMNCPFCGDREKKFAVNLTSGVFNCLHQNKCGATGSFRDLQLRLGDEPQRTYQDPFINNPRPVYRRPTVALQPLKNPEMDFLHGRGFTDSTINRFKVSAKDGAVALPYYRDGQLTGVKYRAIGEKKFWNEKDAEPCLFARDLVRGDILYICEGEFDAMSLYQLGFDDGVVSVPNGVADFRWIETEWGWIDRFREIYLVLDTDMPGRNAAHELARKLGTWRCKDVILPHKDANECLMQKATLEDISACMANAREYVPAMLVDSAVLTEDVVQLFIDGDRLRGTATLWTKLDEILGGWREEELTVWTGRTGAGKSTILNQHAINIIRRGVKICVASLELPAPRYLRWATIQSKGRPDLTAQEVRDVMKMFAGKLYVVNTHETISPDALFEIFEYASRRYDVKHFIVDSLMRIVQPGKDDLKEEKEFVSKLLSFAKKYKIHVHLVAHPRKASKDKEVPGVVDIKGSGHITDLAHNVLVHWRPTEEEIEHAKARHKSIPGGILYVKKNRELGTVGRIRLTFDEQSKRYTDDFD